MQLSQEFMSTMANWEKVPRTCWKKRRPRVYVRKWGLVVPEDYSSLMNTLVIDLVEHKSTQSSQ